MTTASSPTPGATKTALGVHSEVGKLRTVMIHRPDLELKRLTPENHDELLFDDVLWVSRATQQHDAFAGLLRGQGVEVLYLEDMLGEALKDPEARTWVLDRAVTPFTVGAGRLRRSTRLPPGSGRDDARRPPDRRAHRVRGLRAAGQAWRRQHRRGTDRPALIGRLRHGSRRLHPAPAAQQLLHARSLGLAVRRRRRQPHVLARPPARGPQRRDRLSIPPRFKDSGIEFWYSREQEGESFGRASSEGGDIMPIGNRTALIGMSERTTGQMIEKIARSLFDANAADRVIAAGMTRDRAHMHLDTVFTFLDRDCVTLFPSVVHSITAYSVRPSDIEGELDVRREGLVPGSGPGRTRDQEAARHRNRRRQMAGRTGAVGRRQQRRGPRTRCRRRL